MKVRENIPSDWIYRNLRNKLDDKEKILYEQWLSEKSEHREYVRNIERQLLEINDSPISDKNTIWKKLNSRITSYHRRRKRIFLIKGISVAAVFIGALCFSIFLYNVSDNTSSSITNEFVSGNKKAILEMSDGTLHVLGNDECLINKKGGQLIMATNSKLSYTNDSDSEKYEIEIHNLYVPRGAEYKLELEDGTKIRLNSETRIKYPSSFSSTDRTIYLEGEAYFEVERDPGKPFIIINDDNIITVLGTTFGVTAYADEDMKSVTLSSGKVNVSIGKITSNFILEKGHRLEYNLQTNDVEIREVDTKKYLSWKDGFYSFRKEKLENIMQTLSRWYDCEVIFLDNDIREVTLQGQLERFADIHDFLNLIEISSDVEFEIKEQKVYVSKKSGNSAKSPD